MEGHWVNGRSGYRCRHGHSSARPRPSEQPKNLYVREDHLLGWLSMQLHRSNSVDLAADLRETGWAIICDAETWQLAEPPIDALPRQSPHEPDGFMG